MTDETPGKETRVSAGLRTEHAVRDSFRQAWQAGQRPRIADYVAQLPEPVRTDVLRELVALDIQYRSRAGDTPTAADYVQPFPEARKWIGILLADMTTVAGVLAPDTLVQSPSQTSSDPPHSIAATQIVAGADEQPDQPGSARPSSTDAETSANAPHTTNIAFDKFAQALTTSGVMDQAELDTFLANLPPERRPQDGRQLAQELFRGKRLTRFQVQAIYQGKTRGLVIGNYVVLDKLGQGGMGQVYTARHTRMDRIVVIKVLPAAATKSPEAVKRFQREVKAAAKLTHPNIVTAYDADDHRGMHFLVMECVTGKDLARLVQEQGPFPIQQAVDVIIQAARGLEYAHRQGVIHRDIKPQNVLLDIQGVVKILDMGLARLEEQIGSQDDGLTQSGAVMGTLDYMAPEQAMDTKTADARADIYSLGCTLHYLLTGKAPYGGDSLAAKIVAHRVHPIPSLCEQRSDVPETLDMIFQKMVAKNPAERSQTMTELLAELQMLVAQDRLDAASGSHGATLVHAGASVPTELSEESDVVTLDDSAVELTERLLAPSLLLQHFRSRFRRWRDNRTFPMVLAVAGVLGIAVLGVIIVSLWTKDWTVALEVDQPGAKPDAKVEVPDAEGTIVGTDARGKEQPMFTDPPGQHRAQIEKEGSQVSGEAVEPETREKVISQAELEKAAPATSTIVLKGAEAGWLVELLDTSDKIQATYQTDGATLSMPVAAGTHRVRVERDGTELLRQDVGVVPTQTVEVDASEALLAQQRAAAAPPTTPTDAAPNMTQPSSPSLPNADLNRQLPAGAPPPAIAPFDAAQARQRQDAWAKFLNVPVETTNSIGMTLILIPPGEFDMGSTRAEVDQLLAEAKRRNEAQWYIDRLPSEAPQHRVRISQPFALGGCEVTVGQFRQFTADTGYVTEGEKGGQGGWRQPEFAQSDADPVVDVSWNDAVAFCEWLSRKEGTTYRLPTEAEWEYACRSGSVTSWIFGNEESGLAEYAWYSNNSQGRTHPVGEKRPNALGLHDMHGNVWEWCQDWFENYYYKSSSSADPSGPADGSFRVNRGGGWDYRPWYCRSANRSRLRPGYRDAFLGFRVAAVPSGGRSASPASPASGAESGSQ